MAAVSTRVTVTTTPTLLVQADADGVSVIIANPSGGATIDIGGATVTSGGGLELPGGATFDDDLAASEKLYGITASGTQSIQVLTTRG